MKTQRFSHWILMIAFFPSALWADQLELLNGDRLSGRVLTMSAGVVGFESEMLGKLDVPRKNIAGVTFGTNVAPARTASSGTPASPPAAFPWTAWLGTNATWAAALHGSDAGTNIIHQIREQMLAGNPAAMAKFDELADGLMSGKLDLDELRREARASADQLREFQRQDPEIGESLNAYLQVLESFLNEPAGQSLPIPSPAPAKPQGP